MGALADEDVAAGVDCYALRIVEGCKSCESTITGVGCGRERGAGDGRDIARAGKSGGGVQDFSYTVVSGDGGVGGDSARALQGCGGGEAAVTVGRRAGGRGAGSGYEIHLAVGYPGNVDLVMRSDEHTSELQSPR